MRPILFATASVVAVAAAGIALTGTGADSRSLQKVADHVGTASGASRAAQTEDQKTANTETRNKKPKVVKTNAEWRRLLTRKQYHITRERGTERARTGKYWKHKAKGVYTCICCQEPLFDSATKYESGTGWPSFYTAIGEDQVGTSIDRSLFMVSAQFTSFLQRDAVR